MAKKMKKKAQKKVKKASKRVVKKVRRPIKKTKKLKKITKKSPPAPKKKVQKIVKKQIVKKSKVVLPFKPVAPKIQLPSDSEARREAASLTPMFQLQVGELAPHFRLKDDQNNDVTLSDFTGRKVVLYFYPKDDTPGCTREACAFRDGISQLQARGAVVLGLSTDSVESHQAFKQKYNLNFQLLSDDQKEVVQKYGVWKERSMYGRTFMGIERTTFLIDENGRILRIFPRVNVEIHYDEVLNAL